MTAPLTPLFLRLERRRVLVVGAGAVAERKIEELVFGKADVVVVATDATPRVKELADSGAITLALRPFDETDLDGAWLVVAATDDGDVQRRAADGALARRIFCVAVDDIPNCTAYSASVIRREPIVIALSSSGEAPALMRLLREIFEELLPEREWVDEARALRDRWKAEKTPMGGRFAELVRAFKERAR